MKNLIRHDKKTNTNGTKLSLLLAGCIAISQAHSQADPRLVQAETYFAAGEYYTAANLYGQFLTPGKKSISPSNFPLNANRNAQGRTGAYGSRNDILLKQAESYRLANYWPEAADLYKQSFGADSIKYSGSLYWYAVCQRSMAHYREADEALSLFLRDYAAGHPYQQAAEKEKQTLAFLNSQLSRPDTVMYTLKKVSAPIANEKGLFAPSAAGSLFFVTSTQADSVGAGVNPYHNRLFQSSFAAGGLQATEAVYFAGMDASLNQGAASLSADGSHLYLTQWKKENGKMVSAIYHSIKTSGGWSKPQLMPSLNADGYSSKQPFCSADGKYIFFASDRPGGLGQFDIWYAPLHADGTAGESLNAGARLNTADNEQSPFYHSPSFTLVFSSDRHPGMGGYDLFASKGWGSEWKAAENMGYPVNSSRDDVYFFSGGKENLLDQAFFSSDRGGECCLSTYTVTKSPKKKIMTGLVRDCATRDGLANANVVLKDASGKTLTAKTDANGRYTLEIQGRDQRMLSVSKEQYTDKTEDALIESRNEIAWHTDTVYNAPVCMEKKRLVIKVENVVTVYFDFDQSKLKQRATSQLDSIYSVLIANSAATLQISGYTDGLGSVEYNAKLSDRRARACADYLIAKGIDASRISFESFGACCPVEMELINGRDNPDGRSMNRRALINISKPNE